MDDIRRFRDDSVGYCIEDLFVGMSAVYARTVTETDIVLFSGVSGDSNPVHMNELYARGTIFKTRIVHGMLTAAFLSTVIGSKLPGPGSLCLGQNLRFRAPLRSRDTVEACVTVTDIIPEKNRFAPQPFVPVRANLLI